jgi:hypothetical protein
MHSFRAIMRFPILVLMLMTSAPLQNSAKDTVQHFCELDAGGGQLRADSRQQISKLFTLPAQATPKIAIIIKDFVVLASASDSSEFEVEYVYLGRLNLATAKYMRLPLSYPPGPVKVRVDYHLAKATEVAADKGISAGQEKWKIQGAPPEPHINVVGAIQYLNDMQNKTSNIAIKKNSDTTLAILNKL